MAVIVAILGGHRGERERGAEGSRRDNLQSIAIGRRIDWNVANFRNRKRIIMLGKISNVAAVAANGTCQSLYKLN